jgi:proteic killer suppression protein
VIGSFRHKALQRYFETADGRGLPQQQLKRLRLILTALHAARGVEDLSTVPGWRLHRLKGDRRGYWSISVSGNWRIVLRFESETVLDVDLVDYH